MSCLKKYIDYTAIKKLKSARSWPCFLCMPYNVMTHGLLVPRKDWQEYVIRLFNERNSDVTNMDSLLSVEAGPKRRLRVLSLFDGICTGMFSYTLNTISETYYMNCLVTNIFLSVFSNKYVLYAAKFLNMSKNCMFKNIFKLGAFALENRKDE